MAAEANPPVLVGSVPLLYVQSLVMTEGYAIERIATSSFSQALAPTAKRISIDAMLIGPDRLLLKKELEALALVSRALVAVAGPALALGGIPVVSGLTISLDMQITSLSFTQSTQKRDALDVRLELQHVPRSAASLLVAEALDIALAASTADVPAARPPNPVSRTPSEPLGAGG